MIFVSFLKDIFTPDTGFWLIILFFQHLTKKYCLLPAFGNSGEKSADIQSIFTLWLRCSFPSAFLILFFLFNFRGEFVAYHGTEFAYEAYLKTSALAEFLGKTAYLVWDETEEIIEYYDPEEF